MGTFSDATTFADVLARACTYCRERMGLAPADDAPETCALCPTTRPSPTKQTEKEDDVE